MKPRRRQLRSNSWIILLPAALLMASCAQTPGAPGGVTPSSIPPLRVASGTPSLPTPTETPVPTHWEELPQGYFVPFTRSPQERELTEEGPWMVYSLADHQDAWYVVNADGTGRRRLAAIADYVELAELTPLGTPTFKMDSQRLVIYQFPSLQPLADIELVAYPALAEDAEVLDSCAYASVAKGTPKWSKDGRYLALVAAIDGPTADIYLFDQVTLSLRRLTTGPYPVTRLWWSADGRSILFRAETQCFDPETWSYQVALGIVSLEGGAAELLFKPGPVSEPFFAWWLSDTQVILLDSRPNSEVWSLHLLELTTRRVTPLLKEWPGGVFFYPGTRSVVLVCRSYAAPYAVDDPFPCEDGLYWTSLTSAAPRRIDTSLLGKEFDAVLDTSAMEWMEWDESMGRYTLDIGYCDNDRDMVAALNPQGRLECVTRPVEETLVPLAPRRALVLAWSPDSQWAVGVPDDGKTHLYDAQGNDVGAVFEGQPEKNTPIWRPDSGGVFLLTSFGLVYVDVAEQTPILIEERKVLYTRDDYPFLWVGGD